MIFSSNIHFQIIKFVRYFIEIICKASVNIVGETGINMLVIFS